MSEADSVNTRALPIEEARRLPAGADHYRAYVGPPDWFDFMSATQFALLFQLGLRDHHRVLDFGCGSLRLGRLLIPFLRNGGYFGVEPHSWLIEEALTRELGHEILAVKSPTFSSSEDFSAAVFGTDFDFIVAQSLLSHMGLDLVAPFFASASSALKPSGLLLFSYARAAAADASPVAGGWHYPQCVRYPEMSMLSALEEAGLRGLPLPWFHPTLSWMVASTTLAALPPADRIDLLRGVVFRSETFAASLSRP